MQILLEALLQNMVSGAIALSSLAASNPLPATNPAVLSTPVAPTPAMITHTAGNRCLGTADPTRVKIAWEQLRNPIIRFPNHAAKDMAIQFVNGQWQMMFSYIADRPFRFRLGLVTSPDWSTWNTNTVQIWDDDETGGLASPDITQTPDGTFVVAFNSHDYDRRGLFSRVEEKLYYRRSSDFQNWSRMKRLVSNLWDGRRDRLIDVGMAYPSFGLLAGFKKKQTLYLAYSPNGSLDGPWIDIGPVDIPGGLENYQFLQIDGVPHLLGTTLSKPPGYDHKHLPALYRLNGDPNVPANWRNWTLVSILNVPQEEWNGGQSDGKRHERANSAFLCDARPVDGHFYLFYAGSNESKAFNGRGHAAIGVARSRDLQTWEVP